MELKTKVSLVGFVIGAVIKVIHTKYSKHCPYTVAHTIDCVCSKINHGLNHGLFISLLKLILCPYIQLYMRKLYLVVMLFPLITHPCVL